MQLNNKKTKNNWTDNVFWCWEKKDVVAGRKRVADSIVSEINKKYNTNQSAHTIQLYVPEGRVGESLLKTGPKQRNPMQSF